MFDKAIVEMLVEGTVDTLYMTLVTTFFSYVFGVVMAIALVIWRPDGIQPRPSLFRVMEFTSILAWLS